MSEHFFGTGNSKVSSKLGEKLDRIAKRHGASFTWANMPEGPRYWFACPHKGDPFNGETERAVLDDVAAAGLKLP